MPGRRWEKVKRFLPALHRALTPEVVSDEETRTRVPTRVDATITDSGETP